MPTNSIKLLIEFQVMVVHVNQKVIIKLFIAESLQTPKLKLLGIPEQMIENDIEETKS